MDRPAGNKKDRCETALRLVTFSLVCSLISSCAGGITSVQDNVRAKSQRGEYANALQLLEGSQKKFGRRSRLLFLFEKGYLLHLEGKYKESVAVFEQARRVYEELYTRSLSGLAAGLIFTEYSRDYRGEDFERILINVFQALNYCMLGEFDEALVEARDADVKLGVINSRYPAKRKNVYREDAFCRLLMGLLYEASRHPDDVSNACVSLQKSLTTYENDYLSHYGTKPPSFLKEKVCFACSYLDSLGTDCPLPFAGKNKDNAEIIVVQYKGFAPVKQESFLPVILPDGFMSQIAFPSYRRRLSGIESSVVYARDRQGREFSLSTECVEDIGAIAKKNLEDRGLRTAARAVMLAAGKYIAEEVQEDYVSKRYGRNTAAGYRILANIYNLATSRADLRSWQTLPEEIRLARLPLEPGNYALEFICRDAAGIQMQKIDLGAAALKPGEKKFFVVRSAF